MHTPGSARIAAVLFTFVFLLTLLGPPGASAQSGDDDWKFSLTPYVWLPTINANLNDGLPPGADGSPEIEVGPNDLFTALNFAVLLSGEARKGPWSVFTDIVYLDVSAKGSRLKSVDFPGGRVSVGIEGGIDTSVKGATWTLAGGYTAWQTPTANLDVIGGLRYFGMKFTTDWNLAANIDGPGSGESFPAMGSVSDDVDLWDGIVGVRGTFRLGAGHWSMPYYLDVGVGSSSVTWQALLGVAYTFDWGDATLAYRRLAYDQDSDKLIQDLSFSGPALGATFRF